MHHKNHSDQQAAGSITVLLIAGFLGVSAVLGAAAPTPEASEDIELDEVLVKGRKPAETPKQVSSWLQRLVGQFQYEGGVERLGSDGVAVDRVDVRGESQCAQVGAPGLVQCQMNVAWPQIRGTIGAIKVNASSLAPAIALYGLYMPGGLPGRRPEPQHIGHMQVDSRGVAEAAKGRLYGDTLIYKARCADLPGRCERVVQVEAAPDGKVVRTSVVIQLDSKPAIRYYLQWNRVTQAVASVPGATPAAAPAGNAIVPVGADNWLRQLVGKFRFEKAKGQICEILPPNSAAADRSSNVRSPGCDLSADPREWSECMGIGAGPGVRCVYDMGWQETKVATGRATAGFELWGYDPVAGEVMFAHAAPLGLDRLGGVKFFAGKLNGNKLSYKDCSGPPNSCAAEEVTISPDGDWIARKWEMLTAQGQVRAPVSDKRLRIVDEPVKPAPAGPRNPSPRRP